MTFPRTFLTLAATLLLAGCGGSSDKGVAGKRFPDKERSEFLAGCEDSGAGVSACACVIEKVEQRWSFDEFDVIMQRMQQEGTEPPAELVQLSASCARPA